MQGNYRCNEGTKIARPSTIEQLQFIVAVFSKVKANGMGHSWWKEQFCAGQSQSGPSDAVNIAMTEIEPALSFTLNPVDPSEWLNSTIPADFPIKVDEEKKTVTVAAGLSNRLILNYLAEYKYWSEPRGWTIPAFSWYIDQTVGGAIATGTHGSSMRWGSLSSQMRAIKLVLANGTLLELTSPEQNPHLWKALGVSVGRLGVITEVTLRIVPNQDVTRTGTKVSFKEFTEQIMEVQEAYKAAKAANDTDGMKKALFPIDECMSFWVGPTGNVFRTDYTRENKPVDGVNPNVDLKLIQAMEGPKTLPPGVFEQQPSAPVLPDPLGTDPSYTMLVAESAEIGLESYIFNGTFPRNQAYPTELEQDVRYFAVSSPYDQLEVAVPMEKAGDCLKLVEQEAYGPEQLAMGFRSPNFFRFVSGEEFYLSPSNGGPVMYVNMEDFLKPNGGGNNKQFDRVVDILLSCSGRLHWGKAGWPKHLPCFDGAEKFPETWCDFGCAVQELDPTGKFSSESNVWQWKAQNKAGEPVEFSTCCGPDGFKKAECNYACGLGVKIGRPSSIEQLQAIVAAFPKVKANGVGHSWWKEQFCSGSGPDAINVVLTEQEPTLSFILNPVDPSEWITKPIPTDFPIKVNEEKKTVTVAAGLTQRAILDYLANYTHWKEPQGWTTPAFPWFIDQTIAGAVATGSHGSSMRWGSLSSQMRAIKLVLANGTLLELTSPEQNPHLWKALGVSVGRLGVITEVTLRIVPNQDVTRTGHTVPFKEFAEQVYEVQEAYKAAKAANNTAEMQSALAPIDETMGLWVAPTGNVFRADFAYDGKNNQTVIPILTEERVMAMEGPPEDLPGVFDNQYRPAVEPNTLQLDPEVVQAIAMTAEAGIAAYVYSGTMPRNKAFLSELETDVKFFAREAPYEQNEVAVPIERAGDCLKLLDKEMYGDKELWRGFRSPSLFRFISGEQFYISPSNGGPVMYVNMENYLSPSSGTPNVWFDQVMDLFINQCGARMHWGKAGWPKHLPCFDGAEKFPETWCDFGCAVQELDPTGKFSSESNVWQWKAQNKGGEPVEFSTCCGPDGFKEAECVCAPSPSCKK